MSHILKALGVISLLLFTDKIYAQSLLVETELFEQKGGWVVDTQFFDQMGSSYLLAHGMGKNVDDAYTTVTFPETGEYYLWVRTKDWAPFPKGPGKFQLSIGQILLDSVFGASGQPGWKWYSGGKINIVNKETEIRLKDLTGFEGRCDALFFSKKNVKLPDNLIAEKAFRKLFMSQVLVDEGEYDLVVVGGGVAGIAAAVQAARLNLKVALINNRRMLGGNSSSEIGVPMDGDLYHNKYPKLGRIVREMDNYFTFFDPSKFGKYQDKDNQIVFRGEKIGQYADSIKKYLVANEPNISLFEGMHVNEVIMNEKRVCKVIAVDLGSLKRHSFSGEIFADCTGDATLGLLAGADHAYGRESKHETGEDMAPDIADNLVMGSTNQWHSRKTNEKSDFPIEEWMLQFNADYNFEIYHSYFNWETGFGNMHTVDQAEEIRDHNLRAIYGNWAYIKTHKPEKFAYYTLGDISYVTGKRESYRLIGDIFLKQQDIDRKIVYPDAIVTTTWGIDLHYPDKKNSSYFPKEEFIGYAVHANRNKNIYTFPYRCLYSRNVENLFMAGRNISVSHIALGTVRVQRCTGMMGEVVGLASYLCKKYSCVPRDVYNFYLEELLRLVK